MMRGGKSPNMLVVGLLVIVLFVSYNYWSLSQRNTVLKNVLVADQEKLNEIEEKKIYSDKQNSINLEKLKHLEAKQQSAELALKQKDTEINELGTKLRAKNEDLEKLETEIRSVKDKLTACADGKNSDSLKLKTELDDYKKNLTELAEKLRAKKGGDCESKASESVKEYQKLVISEIEKAIDAQVFKKVKAILEQDHSVKASSEDNKVEDKSKKVPSVLSSDDLIQDVCKLPKKSGNCQNTTDRYYFDQETSTCKIFAYSCEGNANNFETLDECHKKCENKNDQTSVEKKTGTDDNDDEKVKEPSDDDLIKDVQVRKPSDKKPERGTDDKEDNEPVIARGKVAKKISGDKDDEDDQVKEKKDIKETA